MWGRQDILTILCNLFSLDIIALSNSKSIVVKSQDRQQKASASFLKANFF